MRPSKAGLRVRDLHQLDAWRDRSPAVRQMFGHVGDSTCGVFMLPSPVPSSALVLPGGAIGGAFVVIASVGDGWDHVSVSCRDRCPTWDEMDAIKRLFFAPDETAMQLHVPPAEHLCLHPYCLHLWRPLRAPIPRPPAYMVGTGAG